MRLRPDEWPAPERGRLTVTYMAADICAVRRTLREANLMTHWVTTPLCRLKLFEPEFIDVVGDGFLLRGHTIRTLDQRVHEHEQIWLVRPRTAEEGPPLPRFDPRPWLKKLPIEERSGREKSTSEQWLDQHPDAKGWTR